MTACLVALVAPVAGAQAQPEKQAPISSAVKASNRLERDALWNWVTYGRLGHYTPELACRDASNGAPDAALAACVTLVRAQAAKDQVAQNTLKIRRTEDEEYAIKELVTRSAAGDRGAEARCQWAVDGMQREPSAWQACRTRVRAAFKSAVEGTPSAATP